MVAIVIGPRLDTRFDCFFAWSADFHIASDEYRGNRLLSEKTSKIDSVDFSMGCFIHLGVRSHILHWVSYCLLCCKAVPVCSGYRNSLANTVKCRLAQPCCLSAYACLSATGSICRNSGSRDFAHRPHVPPRDRHCRPAVRNGRRAGLSVRKRRRPGPAGLSEPSLNGHSRR